MKGDDLASTTHVCCPFYGGDPVYSYWLVVSPIGYWFLGVGEGALWCGSLYHF